MPLPEIIPIRYTEEEAGYVSVRPVVHQTFRIRDLAGMVIRVTGKDLARVRQIFRAGAVVYNGYRYWWAGFEADDRQLAGLLATFPEDDPSRRFRVEECTAVFLETGGGAACRQLEITRVEAARKPFWRRGSVWGILLSVENAPLAYVGYSHAQGGDLYRRAPTRDEATRLLQQLFALAPRALRARLVGLAPPSALLYLCPRQESDPPRS